MVRSRSVRNNNEVIVSLEHFSSLISSRPIELLTIAANPNEYYGAFWINKEGRSPRLIRPPKLPLRKIQRKLLRFLYSRIPLPNFLHGGVPGKSIFSHAAAHLHKNFVATLDVSSFYPSTTEDAVTEVLILSGFRGEALNIATKLVTLDNQLPQGAPTSCLLANASMRKADIRIKRMCKLSGLVYSRYVDDIAISGNLDFHDKLFIVKKALHDLKYSLNEDKSSYNDRSKPQNITGLIVNDKLRPDKCFRSELKKDLWFGIDHGGVLLSDIKGMNIKSVKKSLSGRISHLNQADKNFGKDFRGLLHGINWHREL